MLNIVKLKWSRIWICSKIHLKLQSTLHLSNIHYSGYLCETGKLNSVRSWFPCVLSGWGKPAPDSEAPNSSSFIPGRSLCPSVSGELRFCPAELNSSAGNQASLPTHDTLSNRTLRTASRLSNQHADSSSPANTVLEPSLFIYTSIALCF